MQRLLFLLIFLLVGCTQAEVADWLTTAGFDPTEAEVVAVTEWVNARDCLPGYGSGPGEDLVVECAIADSARHYGLNVDRWARIAWCESSHNPDAANPNSDARGLFQQLERYWEGRQVSSGWHGSIYDPRVNAYVSAWLAATGGYGHWVCR